MTRRTPEALTGRAERERRRHGVEVMPDGTVYVNGRVLKLRADIEERLRPGPPPPTPERLAVLGRLLPPGTYATPDDRDVVTLGRTE